MANLTGLAVAGVVGGAVIRQLRADRDDEGERRRGPLESMLGGMGRGVGQVAGTGLRAAGEVTGAVARQIGHVGAATVQQTLPATSAGAGWLLDGVTGLVVDTGRSAVGMAGRATSTDPTTATDQEPTIGDVHDTIVEELQDLAAAPTVLVVRSARGSRFHRLECRMATEVEVPPIPRAEAVAAALTPCQLCRP
jgi:hypothetical protein